VAARGRNNELPLPPEQGASGYQVLAFDRATLVSGSPNDALIGYGDTHGTAPVGMALFNGDTLLAVANGNRYYNKRDCVNPPPGRPPCTASVAIMDVSNPAEPRVNQTPVPNENDAFPRNVTLGPDGSTLYVPNAGCPEPTEACQQVKRLEVIATSVNQICWNFGGEWIPIADDAVDLGVYPKLKRRAPVSISIRGAKARLEFTVA